MAGSNSIGSATEKRAALLNTLARGKSKEIWGDVLAAIGAQLSGRGLSREKDRMKNSTPSLEKIRALPLKQRKIARQLAKAKLDRLAKQKKSTNSRG